MAGVCVVDVATFIDPWSDLLLRLRLPVARGQRRLSAEAASEAYAALGGVLVAELSRAGRALTLDGAFAARAPAWPEDPRRSVVLATDAPQPLADELQSRLDAQRSAAIVPETHHGRLTGRIAQAWEGDCGMALCLARVAEAARLEFGNPVEVLSDGPCTCWSSVRAVRPA